MTTKADKEKLKLIHDRCQSYLTDLLKDEDNKYCVDCDAKGPRWASWNLGVFLCIRCAGIHRNLGVHISKVKSVNLDAWTPEQIGHLQQMGNSKARAVYEANLPDNFRRPQTDSTLEAFIRSKYEQRKYIAKEWTAPPTPPPAFDIDEERKKEKEGKKQKHRSAVLNKGSGSGSPSSEVQTNSVPRPHSNPAGTTISADKVPKDMAKSSVTSGSKSSNDLLGLGLDFSSATSDGPAATPVLDEDPFDAFVSASKSTNPASAKPVNLADEESDFFNQKVPDKKLDKDSILKMFDNSSNFMTTTQAAPFASNNPMTGMGAGLFAPPVGSGHPNNLIQNGSGSHAPNQTMAMNPTTNPFLASATSGGANNNNLSLFADMRSLNLGPSPTSNWMAAPAAVPQPTSGFDTINPFSTTSVAPGPPAASQSLFADFGQPVRNATEPPALNWGLPAANPIEANRTLPSSDLWQ